MTGKEEVAAAPKEEIAAAFDDDAVDLHELPLDAVPHQVFGRFKTYGTAMAHLNKFKSDSSELFILDVSGELLLSYMEDGKLCKVRTGLRVTHHCKHLIELTLDGPVA